MEECRCDPAIGRVLRRMTKKEEREARKLEKVRLEKERMDEMFSFEREYGDHQAICGIDEVGRGPFAGPVVAAAVILPKDCDILYLNDSKKLSEKKRELLYDEIYEKAVAIGIGMSSDCLLYTSKIKRKSIIRQRLAKERDRLYSLSLC